MHSLSQSSPHRAALHHNRKGSEYTDARREHTVPQGELGGVPESRSVDCLCSVLHPSDSHPVEHWSLERASWDCKGAEDVLVTKECYHNVSVGEKRTLISYNKNLRLMMVSGPA